MKCRLMFLFCASLKSQEVVPMINLGQVGEKIVRCVLHHSNYGMGQGTTETGFYATIQKRPATV